MSFSSKERKIIYGKLLNEKKKFAKVIFSGSGMEIRGNICSL